MSQQDYFILWAVYYSVALVLLLASCFFTNALWRPLKESIVIIVAILLFTSYLIDLEQHQYAPAIAVLAMDILMHVGDHSKAILSDLTYFIEIGLAVYFAFAIFIRWPIEYIFRRWRARKRKVVDDNDRLSEEVTL